MAFWVLEKMAPEDSFREKTERQRAVRIRISAVTTKRRKRERAY